MSKTLIFREFKLLFRNRLTIIYTFMGLIISFASILFIFFNFKPQNFDTFFLASTLGYSSYAGYALFIWDWDRSYYILFITKRKLKNLVVAKILFSIIANLLFTVFGLIIFKINEYDYYFNVLLFSGINGIGILWLIYLTIMSWRKTKINLFDNKVFIVKQDLTTIIAAILLFGFITISYHLFQLFSFNILLFNSIVINLLLVATLKNKITRYITTQMTKNHKIQ